MSDQTTREAAARAFDRAPSRDTADALSRATYGCEDWHAPDGGMMRDVYRCCALWLAHVRTLDAANAAPVAPDPLAGVVFTTPGAVLAWAEQAWDRVRPKPIGFAAMGVSSADGDALWSWLRMNDASGNGWPEHVGTIAAHARAQLAREASAKAGWTPPPFDAQVEDGTAREYAPVSVTLDAAREAAKAHGYRLVHESGHDDPSAVLAALIVGASMSEDDAMTVTMALSSEEHARTGIARLRALGVTPAVLK